MSCNQGSSPTASRSYAKQMKCTYTDDEGKRCSSDVANNLRRCEKHAGMFEECAICLGQLDHTKEKRILPKCKHMFHEECIHGYICRPCRNGYLLHTCPLCRRYIDIDTLKDIDASYECMILRQCEFPPKRIHYWNGYTQAIPGGKETLPFIDGEIEKLYRWLAMPDYNKRLLGIKVDREHGANVVQRMIHTLQACKKTLIHEQLDAFNRLANST